MHGRSRCMLAIDEIDLVSFKKEKKTSWLWPLLEFIKQIDGHSSHFMLLLTKVTCEKTIDLFYILVYNNINSWNQMIIIKIDFQPILRMKVNKQINNS